MAPYPIIGHDSPPDTTQDHKGNIAMRTLRQAGWACALVLCAASVSRSADVAVEWGAFTTRLAATPAGAELSKALNLNFTVPGTAQSSFITMMDRLQRFDGFKPGSLPASAPEQAAAIQKALILYSQDLRDRSEAAVRLDQPALLQAIYAEHNLLARVSPALPPGTAAAMESARGKVSDKIETDVREELDAKVLIAVRNWQKGGFGGLLKELRGGAVNAVQTPDAGKAAFLGEHRLTKPQDLGNRLGPLEPAFNKLRGLQRDGLFKITSPNARGILNDAAAALEKSPLTAPQRVAALKTFITALYSIDVLPNKIVVEEAGGVSYRTPDGIFRYDGTLTAAHAGVDEALVALNTQKLLGAQFSGNAVMLTLDPRANYRNGVLLALGADGVIKAMGTYRDSQALETQGKTIVVLTVRVLQGDVVESIQITLGSLSDVAKASLLAAVENRNRSVIGRHPEFAAALAKEPLPQGEDLWKKPAAPRPAAAAPRTAQQALGDYFAEIEAQHPKGREIASTEKRQIIKQAARLAALYSKNNPEGEQAALWGFLSRMSADENGYFRKDMENSRKGLFYTRSDGTVFKYNAASHAFEPANESSLAVLAENLDGLSFMVPAWIGAHRDGLKPLRIFVRRDGRLMGFEGEGAKWPADAAAIVSLELRADGLILDAAVESGPLSAQALTDIRGVVDRRNQQLGLKAKPDLAAAAALFKEIRYPSTAFTGMGGETHASVYVDRRTGAFIQWANSPLESPDAVQIDLVYRDRRGAKWSAPKRSPWSAQAPLSAKAAANVDAAIGLLDALWGG
ncbi:MAG: hypothetical protein HY077_06355 [Elusimicrobia bacterium]|nr:hypothetical protein [Elusimicrobiota bacterium]